MSKIILFICEIISPKFMISIKAHLTNSEEKKKLSDFFSYVLILVTFLDIYY